MKLFLYLSEILGSAIIDRDGRSVGKLCDVAMRINSEVYPRASGLVVKKGLFRHQYAHVPFDHVAQLTEKITLNIPAADIQFQKKWWKGDFTLCVDVLDQQVVDTDNQKVVRVNDVHLLRVDNRLYLAHVDVGLRGIIRRLEWTGLVDLIVKIFAPRSNYLTQEDFISWKNTQILTAGRYKNVLRLDVARKKLSQIPAADLAEIMEDLDIYEKLALFKSLETIVQRKVFTDLATQEKQDLIEQLSDMEAADLLENIPADEATDVLSTLSKEKILHLTHRMENETAKELRKLLGFAKDSAGGLMTTEYLYLTREGTVADALKIIKDHASFPGNIYHIYVVDEGHRLLGSTSLRRIINEDPVKPILEVCLPKNIFVKTDDGMEEIALLLEKYKFSSIPVVDDNTVLQGVITTDDVMEELIALAWSKYKEKLV